MTREGFINFNNEVIIKNKNLFKLFINNIEINQHNLNNPNDCYAELTNCSNLN